MKQPTALTIGSFDGLHLGHRALLHALKAKGTHTTVLTFTNHPLQVLKPNMPHLGLIISASEKISLLKEFGIDTVIAIPFTLEFASLPFDVFLSQFPLSHLVLGEGSSFGKNREGNSANVLALSAQKGFKAEYLSKTIFNGEPISSRRIRATIASGNLSLASKLLGRPYSLPYPGGTTHHTETTLCLPPNGTYTVTAGPKKLILEINGRNLILSQTLPNPTQLNFEEHS